MHQEKLSREELVELVRKIKNCEGSEKEIDEMTFLLMKNVIDSQVTNYIYCDEKTPEEMVDLVLAYMPIEL